MKSLGCLLIASALSFVFASVNAAVAKPGAGLQEGLAKPYSAPEFSGIEAWLNSKPLRLSALRGKVVLVDFWTYSCYNCVNTLPYVKAWNEKFREQGLIVIGVQAPEFEAEKKIANVSAAVTKFGITYPVAVDNQLDTWTRYNNHYWPAFYLIDKQGQVVYTHFGEGNYAETESNIRTLLAQ